MRDLSAFLNERPGVARELNRGNAEPLSRAIESWSREQADRGVQYPFSADGFGSFVGYLLDNVRSGKKDFKDWPGKGVRLENVRHNRAVAIYRMHEALVAAVPNAEKREKIARLIEKISQEPRSWREPIAEFVEENGREESLALFDAVEKHLTVKQSANIIARTALEKIGDEQLMGKCRGALAKKGVALGGSYAAHLYLHAATTTLGQATCLKYYLQKHEAATT